MSALGLALGSPFLLKRTASSPALTYATWNPADKSAAHTLSGGNLVITNNNTGWTSTRGTIGRTSGKPQFEVAITANPSGAVIVGFGNASASLASFVGADNNSAGCYAANGEKVSGGASNPFGFTSWTAGILTVMFDLDAGNVYVKLNNGSPVLFGSGLVSEAFPMIAMYTATEEVTANFGATPLTYPEAGYELGWYE